MGRSDHSSAPAARLTPAIRIAFAFQAIAAAMTHPPPNLPFEERTFLLAKLS
jgi:hypothetical protein